MSGPPHQVGEAARAGMSGLRGDGATGWRFAFGEFWSALAQDSQRRGDAAWPRVLALRAAAQQDLDRGLAAEVADDEARLGLVSAAAAVLESSALAWRVRGPVAGSRRVALLRRLEHRLEREERDVCSAERPIAICVPRARACGRDVMAALRELALARADRGDPLDRVERAAVEFGS